MSGAPDFGSRYMQLSNQDPYIQSVARQGQAITNRMPYDYPMTIGNAATPLTLAAGALNGFITTLADSDFVVESISASVNLTANSDMKFDRNIVFQLQDTSSGKFFYSAPIVMALGAGAGGYPLKYAAPRVIRPNTTILGTAQNRDTGQDYFSFFLTLHGTRIFYATEQAT